MFIIDDILLWLPLKGIEFIARQVQLLTREERSELNKLKKELAYWQMLFETDEINEIEYMRREQDILARMEEVIRRREHTDYEKK